MNTRSSTGGLSLSLSLTLCSSFRFYFIFIFFQKSVCNSCFNSKGSYSVHVGSKKMEQCQGRWESTVKTLWSVDRRRRQRSSFCITMSVFREITLGRVRSDISVKFLDLLVGWPTSTISDEPIENCPSPLQMSCTKAFHMLVLLALQMSYSMLFVFFTSQPGRELQLEPTPTWSAYPSHFCAYQLTFPALLQVIQRERCFIVRGCSRGVEWPFETKHFMCHKRLDEWLCSSGVTIGDVM
jgi:hypothetical protein